MDDENLIGALEDIESGLSDWEVSFVESISRQGAPLSPGQRKKAEQIWEEKGDG